MKWLDKLLSGGTPSESSPDIPHDRNGIQPVLGDQADWLGHDLSMLGTDFNPNDSRLQRAAEKDVRAAAESSIRRVHKISRGYCPSCGAPLRRHLFASICDTCGWNTYDVPRHGSVKVHLVNQDEVVGEQCYVVQTGAVLVLDHDLIIARVPAGSVAWVEYLWDRAEVERRQKQVVDQMEIPCGWCNQSTDPDRDGFHLVHVAFGAGQERYVFCSDECYEAFRNMYPARVHRNCYERNCADCTLCSKRYGDDNDEIHMLAKDFLRIERRKKSADQQKDGQQA